MAEEDTELRDLLVQTLENNGALRQIKAKLRAAVFLALEPEQEKIENKTPLVNEKLKTFLNTRDGQLVASLVAEFFQFFNLDYTLAVFKPEINTFIDLEGRENLARDLGIIKAEGRVAKPLLLEVIRSYQQQKNATSEEGVLELSYVHSLPKSPDRKSSSHTFLSKKYSQKSQNDTRFSSEPKSRSGHHFLAHETKTGSFFGNKYLVVKDKTGLCANEDDMDSDSSFDDPIPKADKTYDRKGQPSKKYNSLASLSDASSLESGVTSLTETSSLQDLESKERNAALEELKWVSDKIDPLVGAEEEDYYDEDFNSISNHSETSIDEEIEEDLSVEADDIHTSKKLGDLTQDLSVWKLRNVANYLKDME